MFGKVGISVSFNVIAVVLDLRKRSNRIVLESVCAIDPLLYGQDHYIIICA